MLVLGSLEVSERIFPAERTEEICRRRKDNGWFSTHREEIIKAYPEQWVIVSGEKVVGSGEDLTEIFKELCSKGYGISDLMVISVSSDPTPLTWVVAL